MSLKRYRVEPDTKVRLDARDAAETRGFDGDKAAALKEIDALTNRLEVLQELLFAEHRQRVLIVLQGMDTSGKDGVIRHVFDGVNPSGVRVAAFKKPSLEELDHDYLWRVHRQVPGRGEIVIFNRSHYEDVLVVRVHELAPRDVWSRRFDQINAFERMLADEGATILKFFLHIDADEQKQRLEERLADPSTHWKFNPSDLEERKHWHEYQSAYEDVLSLTSTKHAPWYVVPANRKWYRNWVISRLIVDALEDLKMSSPPATFDPKSIRIE